MRLLPTVRCFVNLGSSEYSAWADNWKQANVWTGSVNGFHRVELDCGLILNVHRNFIVTQNEQRRMA